MPEMSPGNVSGKDTAPDKPGLEGVSSFINQSGQTFAVRGVNVLISAVQGVILARVLGAAGKGELVIILFLAKTLIELGHLSLGPSSTYHVGSRKILPSRIYAASIYMTLVLSLLALAVIIPFFPWLEVTLLSDSDSSLTLLALFSFPLVLLSAYIQHICLGLKDITKFNLIELARQSINCIGVLLLVLWAGWGLTGAVYAFVGSQVLSLALAIVLLNFVVRTDFGVRLTEIRELLTYGIQTHLFYVLAFVATPIVLFILKYKTTNEVVGVFSVALAVSHLMLLIPDSVSIVLFPRLAGATNKESADISSRVCRHTLLLTLFTCVVGALIGPTFIRMLYGREFVESGTVFLWLLPGVLIFSIFRILYRDLMGRGRLTQLTTAVGTSLPVTLGLTWFLSEKWLGVGAAIGMSAGYAVMTIIVVIFFLRESDARFREVVVLSYKDVGFYKNLLDKLIKTSKESKK